MTDLNDPQGFRDTYDLHMEKLEEADIPEADREAIQAYIADQRVNTSNKYSTLAAHSKNLRLSAERADVPLTEMDKTDYNQLIVTLEDDYGLSPNTLNSYKGPLRKFFRFQGTDWWEDIGFEDVDRSAPDESKLFSDAEIQAMLDEADHPREQAAFAMLADTGMRIGALCSLSVGMVDLEGEVAAVTFNDDANVKGAEGTIPLTWSRGYIANYLDTHPRSDRDDVAFIHRKERYDDNLGAVSTTTMTLELYRVADAAGIDRERVKTHNFRHTAITTWIRQGLSRAAIEHRAAWVAGSDAYEVYDNVTDEQMNRDIAELYGIVDEAGDAASADPHDVVRECSVCHTGMRANARYCPGCGNPNTVEAATDPGPDDVQEPATTADDLDDLDGVLEEMDVATVLTRLIQKDPSILNDATGIDLAPADD